jgi:polysaccharide biosynthesis protein PslH
MNRQHAITVSTRAHAAPTLVCVRILICANEAPLPPTNGFRLHVSELLKALRADHQVRLLAFLTPDQEQPSTADPHMRLVPGPASTLLTRLLALLRSVLRGHPLGLDELAARMRDAFREELDAFRPDVVHVTSGRLAGLGVHLQGYPSVLAALDALYLHREAEARLATGLRRRLLLADAARLRRFESTAYRRFGQVVTVSEADRRALESLDPSLRIVVIPNGVDADAFGRDMGRVRDPNRVLFTGVMSYAPNVTAAEFLARQVFPLVRRAVSSARLTIVGRAPTARVRALAGVDGVEVTGEVPRMTPWLSGSRVYACPMLSGTGIKNKLLEALASGLPCVVTPLALQGLTVVPGRHVLVGSDEHELASHLVHLLMDDDAAQALGEAGRDYVVSHHSWEAVGRSFGRLYQAVGSRSSAP